MSNISEGGGFVEIPASKRSITQRKLIHGIGINDADYDVHPTINGKRLLCQFYRTWNGMVRRCYSEKSQDKQPSYIGCTVSRDWLLFSNFKKWMVMQDWEGKSLDKDILFQGNKVYAPDKCIFVTVAINSLLTNRTALRGNCPQGVCFHKEHNKFRARCSFNGGSKFIGYYNTPEEAHEAYKAFKYKHIAEVANQQSEPLRSALLAYKIEGDI